MGNGAGSARWSRGIRPAAPGSRVTRLELFYDLVFVFAFLNVTTVTATYPSVHSVVRALLVLALLWWCWSAFAGLGNVVRTDQGVLPVVGFITVAPVFLLALTLPEAFIDRPGGLPGPLLFAGAYLLVRGTQVGVLGWVYRADPQLRRRWLVLARPVLVLTALLVATPSWSSPRSSRSASPTVRPSRSSAGHAGSPRCSSSTASGWCSGASAARWCRPATGPSGTP